MSFYIKTPTAVVKNGIYIPSSACFFGMVPSMEILPRIKIERRTERELIFTLAGDQHGLPNLISKLAIRKPYVSYAAYMLDHPPTSQPRVVIVTDGSRDPLDVLLEVLDEARRYAQGLKEELEKIL